MANLKLGVTIGGNVAIHSGNYNSYAPTLTGGNASGTWAISISGNSATTSQTNFSSLTISGAAVATQAYVTSQGYLTSYTETDPYRVTSAAVTGTTTKTLTLTRADSSTVTATWTDYDSDSNTFVNAASFNTGNGILTLTRNDGGTVTVDLDDRYALAGSYLTAESDTLATVTSRGNTATGDIYVPSGAKFRARYDGANNYHSSLDWYGLQLGNNGANYIIAGRTNAGGKLVFYTNNTSDFTTINGAFAATMHATGRTSFGQDSDNGYQVQVYGSLYSSDWIRVGGSQGLYFESYGGGFRMIDSTWVRIYNDKNLYTAGVVQAAQFEDANDSNYYVNPAGTSNIWRLQANDKYHYFGSSSNWDNGSLNGENSIITNVHFQGHPDFWIGAGNTKWYTSVASGHHDLLINTMQSGGSNTRGITFTATSSGASAYRLGRWFAHSNQAGSYLQVDGSIKIGATSDSYITPTAKLHVTGSTSGADVFAVDGINGRLFTVSDDLSDSLFSVNTIAGLPVIEAFADNIVKIGKYGTNAIHVGADGRVGFSTTDFSYTTGELGSPTANKVFVNGSIQLLGANDAIVFGRGTGTTLKDENLLFGWGGGWYMTDSSYVRTVGNKAISTGGGSVDYVGSIYMNGGVYIQTYNDRNLIIKGSSSSDTGIEGRNAAGNNTFQIYGEGTNYGFLNGTWAAWDLKKTKNGALYMNDNNSYYLHTNSTSYLYSLSVNQNLFLDNNYGSSIVGIYSDTRYQGIFAMGNSYKLALDGTSPGTLYGLAWTHSNIGGESKSGLGHQLLIMDNGVTKSAIGIGIWTAGLITTTSHGNSSQWNTAYGWGNHASSNYIVRGSTQDPGAWTEATKFKSRGDIGTDTSGEHSLHIYADNGNDAFMAFHISGDYAVFFGLDDSTNRLYTGGWSAGATKYQIWDSRDFSSTNISNWNTAYGWGNHASAGYLTSLPSHTHDDRYYTESESDARFQPLENQRLSTSNSVTFSQVYTNNWFRNNSINTGLYQEAGGGNHWYAEDSNIWTIGANGSYPQIRFRSGGHQGTIRGYVYADTSNNIGFLNNGGAWSLRTDSSRNTVLFGNLTVGQDVGYSSIYMYDSDEGSRELHCNSNRIGFLTQAGAWGAYADDSANWFSTGYIQSFTSMYSPIYYDGNDSSYYGDFASTSRLNTLHLTNHIKQGNNQAFPLVKWGASSSTTGMVVIKLPGNTNNYGMVHMQINVYEYNGNNVSTIIVGGHNWGSRWYSYGAKTLGQPNKQIRVGFRDGQYCVIIGDTSSTWSYGSVSLVSINNGEYYDNQINLSGAYSISQVPDETFDWISENLNNGADVPYADYATTAGTLSSMNISQFTNNSGYLTSLPSHTHDDRYYTETESDARFAAVSHSHEWTSITSKPGVSNWSSNGNSIDVVVGMLSWKNYGDGHIIFDASRSTSPSGSAVSNANPDNYWTGTYPTLMGWNGANTYGVRVDVSRYSESTGSVAWTNVSSRPTALSQFTNDLGNYGGWITSSGSISGNAATATSATQVVTIQDSAPGGAAGKLWWESDTGKLKVYYGSAWVDATPVPDMALYYAKAGGSITGDVTIQQTLTVVGNTLVQGVFTETSDISLKENIRPLESSLDKVMKLNGVSFNKKTTPHVKEIGFIAQEVEEVIPDLVTETNDGIKTVSYSRVSAILVETIKEQQAQIDELKEMVNTLTKKLNNL